MLKKISALLFIQIFLMGANLNSQTLTGQEVWINGSVGKLYAMLELPDLAENSQCPMVILCHGFRGSLHYLLWDPLTKALNARGIGVLRFDFNGCGKSEGEFANMTVPNEIDDLMSVIAYVRGLPTTKNISLIGHSQGGVVCGMAAGICGENQIRALILNSAAAVLRDDALRGQGPGGLRYDPWHLDKAAYPMDENRQLGRAYIQTAMNLPIYETTAKYKGPTLIMNGMADVVVPYTYAQRYKNVMPQAQLLIVPGVNHNWSVDPEFAVKYMTDWLVNTLKD